MQIGLSVHADTTLYNVYVQLTTSHSKIYSHWSQAGNTTNDEWLPSFKSPHQRNGGEYQSDHLHAPRRNERRKEPCQED
jgi:hypothetical protein